MSYRAITAIAAAVLCIACVSTDASAYRGGGVRAGGVRRRRCARRRRPCGRSLSRRSELRRSLSWRRLSQGLGPRRWRSCRHWCRRRRGRWPPPPTTTITTTIAPNAGMRPIHLAIELSEQRPPLPLTLRATSSRDQQVTRAEGRVSLRGLLDASRRGGPGG